VDRYIQALDPQQFQSKVEACVQFLSGLFIMACLQGNDLPHG
jgi:hypothetical protein